MRRDELISHLNTEPSFILMCLSGFVAPQVPGEAAGPGFSLSGHKGFGDWTRFRRFRKPPCFEDFVFFWTPLLMEVGFQDDLQDDSDPHTLDN